MKCCQLPVGLSLRQGIGGYPKNQQAPHIGYPDVMDPIKGINPELLHPGSLDLLLRHTLLPGMNAVPAVSPRTFFGAVKGDAQRFKFSPALRQTPG